MFYAIDEGTGCKVRSDRAVDMHTAFLCPCCNKRLILKNGTQKATHFAHINNTHCDSYYKAENVMSEWHRYWQEQFPEENREVVIKYKDEKHIADVCINGYVIEFQHSSLSAGEYIERTKFYVRCGFKVIWIFDFYDECDTEINDYECKLEEFDDGKWKWKNPKKTFAYFNPTFDYYKKNVILMFEDNCENIHKITWCIHRFDEIQECYVNSYTRFCTNTYKIWNCETLVEDVMKKRIY